MADTNLSKACDVTLNPRIWVSDLAPDICILFEQQSTPLLEWIFRESLVSSSQYAQQGTKILQRADCWIDDG